MMNKRKINKLKYNIKLICNLLNVPLLEEVYFGDDAVNKILEYTNYNIKSINGIFIYRNKDGQLLKNPMICIVNFNIGTLAHELYHYKQFIENDNYLLNMDLVNKNKLGYFYEKIYPYYCCEKEAFNFALDYLKYNIVFSNKLSDSVLYYYKYLIYKLNYCFLRFQYSYNYYVDSNSLKLRKELNL